MAASSTQRRLSGKEAGAMNSHVQVFHGSMHQTQIEKTLRDLDGFVSSCNDFKKVPKTLQWKTCRKRAWNFCASIQRLRVVAVGFDLDTYQEILGMLERFEHLASDAIQYARFHGQKITKNDRVASVRSRCRIRIKQVRNNIKNTQVQLEAKKRYEEELSSLFDR